MKPFARVCFACATGMFIGAMFISGTAAGMAVTLGLTFTAMGLFAMTLRR